MKQLLFLGLVVGPCLAKKEDRFAEDLDEAAPNEAPWDVTSPPTVAATDDTSPADTRAPIGGTQITSTLLFSGQVSDYTETRVNTQIIPAVRTTSGYSSDQVDIQLVSVLPGSVQITLVYVALVPGITLQQLTAAAQNVINQANTAGSPLRAALPTLTGAVPLILYTASPIPGGDKLSDGALAGIVVASIVVGIGLLVAIYCAVKSDAEAERASKAEQAAVPYGGEDGDVVPEKPQDEMV